jgi:hypothetical protein
MKRVFLPPSQERLEKIIFQTCWVPEAFPFWGGVDHFRLWVNNSYVSYILLKLSYLSRWCSPKFQEACFETSHLSAFFCPWNVSVRCYIHLPELIGKLDRFDLDRLQVKSVSIHFIFPSTNPGGQIPSLTGKNHIFLYSNHTKDRNVI